jgi:hypothetical protein
MVANGPHLQIADRYPLARASRGEEALKHSEGASSSPRTCFIVPTVVPFALR